PLLWTDVSAIVAGTELVRALALPRGCALSRRKLEALRELARAHAAELKWFAPGKLAEAAQLRAALAAPDDVTCLVLHGPASSRAAGEVRAQLGRELGILDTTQYRFCWVVDFPMYERERESGAITFCHNPFSMPQGGAAALAGDPLDVLAYQYDIVCN